MFLIIIMAYIVIGYGDLKATYHNQDKAKLTIYFIMMFLSCAYGIASVYMKKMPTPADPIKEAVLWVIGK